LIGGHDTTVLFCGKICVLSKTPEALLRNTPKRVASDNELLLDKDFDGPQRPRERFFVRHDTSDFNYAVMGHFVVLYQEYQWMKSGVRGPRLA
jgi:hypothetical protein